MKIEGLPADIATAVQARIKGMLTQREQARVEGDATAMLDEQSSRYIQRYKGKDKKEVRAAAEPDAIQAAIEEALSA